MAELSNVFRTPIYMESSEFATRKTEGTLSNYQQINLYDIECPEITKGTTDPTTATAASKVGDFYLNTTSGAMFKCSTISGSTYTWVKMISENDLHAGATTLDATLVAGKQYILASQSATFNMVLPTTGTYNDEIEVVFAATAAFTPTASGGSILGDSLPQTTTGKTYDFLFSWVGTGWLLSWLAW